MSLVLPVDPRAKLDITLDAVMLSQLPNCQAQLAPENTLQQQHRRKDLSSQEKPALRLVSQCC